MSDQPKDKPPLRTGGLELPDFKGVKFEQPAIDDGPQPGTVVGLDYDKFATAIIDLSDKPERIATERRRVQGKGYQQVRGDVEVIGYPVAEVWVIPRAEHDRRVQARRERLRAAVRSGRLSDTALLRPTISRNEGGNRYQV